MPDLKKYLASKNCTMQKQFRCTDDRCICLVRRPDGSNAVWRLYDRPVFAYKTLVSTKCPQLPEVYDFTESDCGECLVEEEFINGISLAELIEVSHLDESQTAAVVYQVCKALAVLHRKNMVHRDIKPENILITSDGRVVLIDLDAVSPRTSNKDRDTQLLGTVGYAAPEQYGFGHSDGRTDIFGIGVLMNVLLTGKHPVQELTGGSLRLVVEKCIAVNVDQRYATVEELMAQLPIQKSQKCPLCGFTSPGGGCIFCGIHTEPLPVKYQRKRTWLPVAAGVLLVAGICGAIWGGHDAGNDVLEHQETDSAQTESSEENAKTAKLLPDQDENAPEGSSTVLSPSSSPVMESQPENVPAPSSGTPDTVPIPSGEPTHEVEPFCYDLDGDGTEEEYYFGVMTQNNTRYEYTPKLLLARPTEEGQIEKKALAPVVWRRTSENVLVTVPQFSTLLEDPEIVWYEYQNTTPPVMQDAEPMNGWAGTAEISYSNRNGGSWIAEARAKLGDLDLSICIQVLTYTPNNDPMQTLALTEGAPVGEPVSLSYRSKNELLFSEYTVYGCSAQSLDNDYIRFFVDFEAPAGLNITVFDPPDGDLFRYTDRSGTSGGRGTLVFDLPREQVRAVTQFSITFSNTNEGRFLLFLPMVEL